MSKRNIQELIDTSIKPDWQKINDFVIACGDAHDPKGFVAAILNSAPDLLRFDRAFVLFFDGNGKVIHQHLSNISNETSDFYMSSFAHGSEAGNHEYSIDRYYREIPDTIDISIINWLDEPETVFIREYIRPQDLAYSMVLIFYDLYGNIRTAVALDKLNRKPWTGKELADIYYAFPHLSNLYKNFFYSEENGWGRIKAFSPDNSGLTKREAEIANLLCQGVSPANVSSTLYISIATTYKHISNIYEKLGISSQRELLALMLSR